MEGDRAKEAERMKQERDQSWANVRKKTTHTHTQTYIN